MTFRKIPNEDKKYLDPEAKRGAGMVTLGSGRVYYCIESANRFSFAWWERVSPWRHPIRYVRIRFHP